MVIVRRWVGGLFLGLAAWALSGCMASSIVATVVEQTPVAQGNCLTVGCASLEIAAYVVDQVTEGNPTPCRKLNSVARALAVRCGYDAGSLQARDVVASGLPVCPLTLAARDARLWPVLPELLDKGANPVTCHETPLAALAVADACPDFAAASSESLAALRRLAENDPRAVQHDVVRLLSCPNARRVALDTVLDDWAAQGRLPAARLGFNALAALHPSALESPLAHRLEAEGHRASAVAMAGRLPNGFDLALRNADFAALDWWFARRPELANGVPSAPGGRNAWLPLARVLTPSYLADASRQADLVTFLIARGASPKQALPYESSRDVLALARQVRSPVLAQLEAPAPMAALAPRSTAGDERLAAR